MEIKNDAQLIHRTLSGDEAAFNVLVRRYEKKIHTFAWQKLSDFHLAEEITQDTFLQAYKKLATLRNPNRFVGWLCVIANRHCIRWMRRKKFMVQSLETASVDIVEKYSYECYMSEQQEIQSVEHRYKIVNKLLAKLPKDERKVITLHYLNEMPVKEIGKLLDVPANTIKSQLQRARKRLQA